jgi:hypothetical protein
LDRFLEIFDCGIMTRLITYSLRDGERDSHDYYQSVAAFADSWFAVATRDLENILTGFRAHRLSHRQSDRTDAEYAFELLALGVLLHEHVDDISRLPNYVARLLNFLVRVQEHYPSIEDHLKRWRGRIAAWARSGGSQTENGDDVDSLIKWLRANGATTQADRFAQWQSYFHEIGFGSTRHITARCIAIASDFIASSEIALGKYTPQVPTFLAKVAPKYQGRYDAELVSRTRAEYHLGMLGTEILNRAYRQRFLSAKQKIVIVPPCMRAQPEDKCKAIQTRYGAKCQACTPSCRVHQITKLGEKRGFDVYIIPDELRVFGAGAGDSRLGVVGVSCALTNWSGGWDADDAHIAAQGVLLDYVGCTYHWDDEGFPTDTNLKKLQEVVGIMNNEE